MYQDALIYGKNQTENLVSLEVDGDKTVLFIEKDGELVTEEVPNKFWLLSDKSHGRNWVKLKGDLHFKWGLQSSNIEDINKTYYYLKKTNQEVYRMFDLKESFMVKYGYTYFKGLKHTDPSILSFDIESTGLIQDATSKVLIISNTFRSNGEIARKIFCHDEFETQGQMIDAWCEWVREVNPGFIIGHNIYTYDLPYLNHIAMMEGTELRLGRDGSALTFNKGASNFRIDGSRTQAYHKVRCYGREIIDTMFLAIKWDIGRQLSSYGLKSIIKELNLEKEKRTFYDASKIRHNYHIPEEWEKIVDYCKDDSDDALALYDKAAPAFFYMTQCIPKSFQSVIESASGSQLNSMMVRGYLQKGHSIPKASPVTPFQGAISAGIPGVYKNVKKWDVVSEYPSIIRTYEVYDSDKDPEANLIKLTNYFFEERIKYKQMFKETGNQEYDAIQNCFKVLLNSLYGFLGSSGTNFNFPEGAEFITKRGREIVSIAIEWATSKQYEDWVKPEHERE